MKNLSSYVTELATAAGVVLTGVGSIIAWKRKKKKDKIDVRFEIDKKYEERIVELSEINNSLHEMVFSKTSEAAKYRLVLIQLPINCPECAECIKKITDKL